MSNNFSLRLPGVFFAVLGISIWVCGSFNFNFNVIYFLMVFFGIAGVFLFTGRQLKAVLFLSAFVFMSGIYYLIIRNFELLNKITFPFPVLLIITGAAFWVLYIDDTAEKTLLVLSILLLVFGFIALKMNHFWFIRFANNLCVIIYNYWQVFLIFIGMNLMLTRKAD